MQTLLLDSTQENINKAGEILRNGGLVGMPTETVYGLAADALNGKAVAKIFKAKGRPMDNPLIVHIAEFGDIEKFGLVAEIPSNNNCFEAVLVVHVAAANQPNSVKMRKIGSVRKHNKSFVKRFAA